MIVFGTTMPMRVVMKSARGKLWLTLDVSMAIINGMRESNHWGELVVPMPRRFEV